MAAAPTLSAVCERAALERNNRGTTQSQTAACARIRFPVAKGWGDGSQAYARAGARVSSGSPDKTSDGLGRALVGTRRRAGAGSGRGRLFLDDPTHRIGAGADAAHALQLW